MANDKRLSRKVAQGNAFIDFPAGVTKKTFWSALPRDREYILLMTQPETNWTPRT
jgi:hypothetical protein